jgi:hypothetical protein
MKEKEDKIKQEIGLTTATITETVSAANVQLGLQAVGTIAAQLNVIMDALGLT